MSLQHAHLDAADGKGYSAPRSGATAAEARRETESGGLKLTMSRRCARMSIRDFYGDKIDRYRLAEDALLAYGTEIGPNRFMLRKRDAANLIQGLRKQIARLERLAGKEAVVADGRLITAYHRTRPNQPSGRTRPFLERRRW